MNNRRIVYILSSIAVLLSVLLGGFLIISKNIDTNSISMNIKKSIQTAIPGAQVEIGEVQSSVSTLIRLKVDFLKISQKGSRNLLADLGQIEIKIPIMALFARGMSIDIVSSKMEVFFSNISGNLNWADAIAYTDKPKSTKSRKIVFFLPKFVQESKVNLRSKEVNVFYRRADGDQFKFLVPKFVIKNLNLNKSSAFELVADIARKDVDEAETNLKIQFVGEFLLRDLLEEHDLKVNSSFRLISLKKNNEVVTLPATKGTLNLKPNESGQMNGQVKFSIGSLLDSSFTFSNPVEGSHVYIENLKAIFLLDEIMNQLSISHSKNLLSTNGSKLFVSGRSKFNLSNSEFTPELEFKTSKKVGLALLEAHEAGVEVQGSLIEESLDLSAQGDFAGGKINIHASAKNYFSKTTSSTPLKVSIDLSKNAFTPNSFQSKVWPSLSSNNAFDRITDLDMIVRGKSILVDGIKTNTIGKFSLNKNFFHIKGFELTQNNSNLSFRGELSLLSPFRKWSKLHLISENFKIQNIKSFIPKKYSGAEGNFNLDISGSYGVDDKKQTDLRFTIKANQGKLSWLSLNNNLLKNFNLISSNLSDTTKNGEFQDLVLKGGILGDKIKITNLLVEGKNKGYLISADGTIFDDSSKLSKVNGRLTIGKYKKLMKKITGKHYLPFQLTGKGKSLELDQDYMQRILVLPNLSN